MRAKIIHTDKQSVVKEIYDKEYYDNAVKIYEHIKFIKYVPKMKFEDGKIIMPNCGFSLNTLFLDQNIKIIIKTQIIEFINEIFKYKVAHRDLHTKNICWDGSQIWVIDWEFSTLYDCKNIINHYDLTGEGLCSPSRTSNMNIFKDNPYSLINWFKPIDIIIEEFKI